MRSRQYPFLPSTLRVALLLAAIGSTSISHHVFAQTNEVRQQISIPAQPLASALQALGEQTGLQIIYNSELVKGIQSPAVNDTTAPTDALKKLLGNSTIQFSISGNAVTLSPVSSLKKVHVYSSMEGSTESTMSYTAGKVSVGKTDTAIKDIPQTISIVSHQQIQDQNLTDLFDALDEAPGLTLEPISGAQAYRISSRGFAITSFRYDGGAPTHQAANSYTYLSDLIGLDHVEILRGSDALFSGAGDPGGSVNLVRKRPTAETQIKLNASVGSWDNYRAEVDAGGSLSESWRGRIAVMAQDRNFFHDRTGEEKQAVFAVTEIDISDSSLLTLGGSLEHKDATPWVGGGIPDYEDGSSIGLPRNTSYAFDWNNIDTETSDAFIKYQHRFSEGWTFNLNTSHREEKNDEYFASVGYGHVLVNKDTGILPMGFTTIESDIRILQTSVDANINGSFRLFGREHQVLFGLDWQELDWYMWSEEGWGVRDVNLLDFDPADFPRPEEVPADWKYDGTADYVEKRLGAYTSGRFEITDKLHAIVGGRLSNIDGNVNYDTNKFTPYVGFTYALTSETSLYGSVADVFKSQQYLLDAGNNPLEPMTGRNHELGVKTELWEGAANGYIALYRVERDGEAVKIPGSVYPCCSVAEGLVVSEGVEIELTGEVMPNWNLAAAYTYNDYENREPVNDFGSATPRDLFKLWSTYQLSGDWSAWKLGVGWDKQSEFVSNSKELSGFDTWSLFAEYRINDNLTASFNADNIFDESSYRASGWYGEPRNYSLNLRAQF